MFNRLRLLASFAVVLLAQPSAEAEPAVAKAPWPKAVRDFPAGDNIEFEVGRYQVTRHLPEDAEERARGGTAGPMVEIILRDTTTNWKTELLEQSCGERLLEDFNGRPQLEIWTRGGGGSWSRELVRYLAGKYRPVRVDHWEESPPHEKEVPRTRPPFSSHGDEEAEPLYFINSDIPSQETISRDYYLTDLRVTAFPQIIQSDDYATIQFIEMLFASLKATARERQPVEEFGKTAAFEVGGEALIFRSKNRRATRVTVGHPNEQSATLGQRRFQEPATAFLVATLMNLCGDLATTEDCREARFAQFGTRTYRRRTIIGLDFGDKVLELEAMSNGPREAERLYILDLVEREKSFFWSRPHGRR